MTVQAKRSLEAMYSYNSFFQSIYKAITLLFIEPGLTIPTVKACKHTTQHDTTTQNENAVQRGDCSDRGLRRRDQTSAYCPV